MTAPDREIARFDVPFARPSPIQVHRPSDPDGSVVVALHGQGMSPRSFARELLPAMPPGATVVLPQAPLPFEIRTAGEDGVRFKQGNGWYVYLGDTPEFLVEMERAEAWLRDVRAAVLAADWTLDADRVALLGFSQGGYLAGFVGLRAPELWCRLVVAGARMKHEVLADAARHAAGDHEAFRVLAVHGEEDSGVPPGPSRASAEAIGALGVPVEFRTYAGAGHHVLRDPECQADVAAFLAV